MDMSKFPFEIKRPTKYDGLEDHAHDLDWKKCADQLENWIAENPYRDGVRVVHGDYPNTDGTRLSYEHYFNDSIQKKLVIIYSVINHLISIDAIFVYRR